MPANLLGLRENPFAAGHDPRLIFESESRAANVAGFRQALGAGEPFILVTGEPGVGKTSLVTQVLSDEKAWSALITNPLLTRAELLEEICLRFGVDLPESVSKPRLLAELERHLTEIRRENETPVLVVDEAHDLSLELLEELRLLSNLEFKGQPLVQIVMVGLPALEARLAQPDLAQLRQRIGVHLRLEPLDGEGTWRYVHHRVAASGGDGPERFPDETCLEIHRLTRGVPRAINTLAGHALLVASRGSERVVTLPHVQAAAADSWLRNVADAPPAASAPAPAKPERVAQPKTPSGSDPGPATSAKEQKGPAKPASKSRPEPAASETSTAAVASAAPAAVPKPAAPRLSAADPDPAPEPGPPRVSGEAEVREWISRFVDPDNPIQIGVHAASSGGPFLEGPDPESEVDMEGAAPAASPVAPGQGREGRRAAPAWTRGMGRQSAWNTAAALALLVIATAVVIVPRIRSKAAAPADSAAVATSPAPPVS